MRKFRPHVGGWSLALIGVAGVVALGVLRKDVRANPPAPFVVERPHEAPAARPRVGHVLIISEDGLRADAVEKLHLHWHELLRAHGAWSLHAKTIRDASTLP